MAGTNRPLQASIMRVRKQVTAHYELEQPAVSDERWNPNQIEDDLYLPGVRFTVYTQGAGYFNGAQDLELRGVPADQLSGAGDILLDMLALAITHNMPMEAGETALVNDVVDFVYGIEQAGDRLLLRLMGVIPESVDRLP
jgi:hypothetical protein